MNLQDIWKDLSPAHQAEALKQLGLKAPPKSKGETKPPLSKIPSDATVWKCGWTWNFQGAQVACHCGKCKKDISASDEPGNNADPLRR